MTEIERPMTLAADRSLSIVQPWLHRKRPIGVEMGKLIHVAIASRDGLNRC
ncbi:MAG TPA: hypothetical protein VFH44_04565 [Solirubrobacterales bacterium]|nr:hypothetical protein [Solirubrobacterales bacterium]